MTDWQRRSVAIHEAGHAVVAVCVNVPITVIELTPVGGFVRLKEGWREMPIPVESIAAMFMAGGLAEQRAFGRAATLTASDDEVVAALMGICSPAERDRTKATAVALSTAMVCLQWNWIELVADALLKYAALTAADVRKLKPTKG